MKNIEQFIKAAEHFKNVQFACINLNVKPILVYNKESNYYETTLLSEKQIINLMPHFEIIIK